MTLEREDQQQQSEAAAVYRELHNGENPGVDRLDAMGGNRLALNQLTKELLAFKTVSTDVQDKLKADPALYTQFMTDFGVYADPNAITLNPALCTGSCLTHTIPGITTTGGAGVPNLNIYKVCGKDAQYITNNDCAYVTGKRLAEINAQRTASGLPPITSQILYQEKNIDQVACQTAKGTICVASQNTFGNVTYIFYCPNEWNMTDGCQQGQGIYTTMPSSFCGTIQVDYEGGGFTSFEGTGGCGGGTTTTSTGTSAPEPTERPPHEPRPGLFCSSLKGSAAVPGVGDVLTLTCNAAATTTVNHFDFQYRVNTGAWQSLPAGTAQSASGGYTGTSQLTVATAGNYEAQCRVCKDATGNQCTEWGMNQ